MRTLVATVALAAFVAACATPTPTPSASPVPTVPTTPPSTPVPAADLVVAGTVREWCGSIGGCAYFISIDGPGGSWKAEFGRGGQDEELAGADGMPTTIPAGTYTLTLSSVMVSDAIINGVRQFGPADATCSTTLNVRGDQPIRIEGMFDKGSCEVGVKA
jgi:hypothetical protein